MSEAQSRAVLVTGASTPLGRALCELLERDPRVHGVLAVRGPHEAPPANASARTAHVEVDLLRPRSVNDLLLGRAQELGVSAVVHAPLHDDPFAHGAKLHELEVEGTRTLLDACEQAPGIERFVLRSFSDVYRVERDEPVLIDEDQPLELATDAKQSVRDHAEADLLTCARAVQSRLRIAVLRCAEILAPGTGSPLFDYLGTRVCLRPLGYDPMLNLLSLHDAARALLLATFADACGAFNVPGLDTLPLSALVDACGRTGLPVPGPLLPPLYALRRRATARRFDYAFERSRFHYGAVLDGRRARAAFGYVPQQRLCFDELFLP